MKINTKIQDISSGVFRIFLSIIILFFMVTIIWNNLAKSQDDPETIEQMVDRKIAAHNNNTIAHNEPGQSLDLHRKDTIIDHPAGSVKNDKTSFHDFYYDQKWTDSALWNHFGTAYSFSNGMMDFWTSGVTQYSRYYRYFPNMWYRNDLQPTFYISTKMWSENDPNPNLEYGFGFMSATLVKDKISGFVFKNNKLYATLVDLVSGNVIKRIDHEIPNMNIFDNAEHDLRFYHLASEKKYQWFIDGDLVYEFFDPTNLYNNVIDSPFGYEIDFVHNDNYEFGIHHYDPVFSVDYTY